MSDHIRSSATPKALLPPSSIDRLFPAREECSMLTVCCMRDQYSGSLLARAVEDADAHLLNLNVTSDTTDRPGEVVVEIRASHRNALSVARSLERYGFRVTAIDSSGGDELATVAEERLHELMAYLDV